MNKARKDRRHPMSVSATELAKLGACEVMVALDIADAADSAMRQSARRGEQEHERYHVRAVLNAGAGGLIAKA